MVESLSKAARIEFRKQFSGSTFWILLALHTIILVLVTVNLQGVLANANIVINDMPQADFSLAPILQFPDIWQNLTYVAGYFKFVLALVIIISVCNEFVYSTARQNIVNGLSRQEWIISKLTIALLIAFYSTLLIIAICLVLGFKNSDQASLEILLSKSDFVVAYFIELFVYFIYALFIALLLKRTGIALILLLVYDIIIEPIIGWTIPDAVYRFMPMNALDSMNTFPFTKYFGSEVQTAVSLEHFAWAILYGIAFTIFSYLIFKRQDL